MMLGEKSRVTSWSESTSWVGVLPAIVQPPQCAFDCLWGQNQFRLGALSGKRQENSFVTIMGHQFFKLSRCELEALRLTVTFAFVELREEFAGCTFASVLRTLQVGDGSSKSHNGLAIVMLAETLSSILEQLCDLGLPGALGHDVRISESGRFATVVARLSVPPGQLVETIASESTAGYRS